MSGECHDWTICISGPAASWVCPCGEHGTGSVADVIDQIKFHEALYEPVDRSVPSVWAFDGESP